ncbi:hypothetical protein [Myxococcus sp. CA040A]|uniref:hypothetical protein n=1 Tax=Myxococcus sp. CA040A TaxID=2741738 RepID=UPI00157B69DF|nr:hypothetical protein [Myxococcus sp. CA040A]NTX06903.1 hypothetical protein [Myxococcus sp. CA040A]
MGGRKVRRDLGRETAGAAGRTTGVDCATDPGARNAAGVDDSTRMTGGADGRLV